METPLPVANRAQQYARSQCLSLLGVLGHGKDGQVWYANRPSAVKVHVVHASYQVERNAYIRLRNLGIAEISGLAVPKLVGFDDALFVVEMTIVTPPSVVDFASAVLDHDPALIEDEGHTLEDLVHARFGERADRVLDFYYELIARAGST